MPIDQNDDLAQPYDALLLVSFGGPEQPADIMPFLENVLRGRNVPRERMLEVAHHYERFGGVSPINAQNRQLIAALQREFAAHDLDLPIYWGNRNWHPFLADTMQQLANDGKRNVLALLTSAYSSYSSCRQYREDIARAQASVGDAAPNAGLLRKFYNHPGFIQANVANVQAALDQIPLEQQAATRLVFTAHSIPLTMARTSRYEVQLREACALVATRVGHPEWDLVYQSRSGPPSQPWLEPDIGDHLRALRESGVTDVVVSPIGFVSDHLEVLYDLDTEAQEIARDIGLTLIRAATAGTHPAFISMIYALVIERMTQSATREYLGSCDPSLDICMETCCQPPPPRPT
jgi:protoporphyrin/coproporphyrin ferrochelatase